MKLKIFVLHMNRMWWFWVEKPTAVYGRKRGEKQTDSSPSLIDGFSTYLDFRRLRFRHQVWPTITYILGMWHKHLFILTKTEKNHSRLQVPAKLFFPTEVSFKSFGIFWKKKARQSPKALLTNANPSVPSQVRPGPGLRGGSPGRAAASSWGHPANPRRDSAGRCILPSSPSPLLFTPAQLGGFLAPGPADARSPPPRVPHRPISLAPWVWNPVGPGPAPAGGGKLSVSPHTTSCPRSQPGCNFSSLAAVGQSRRRRDSVSTWNICLYPEDLHLLSAPSACPGGDGVLGRRPAMATCHQAAPTKGGSNVPSLVTPRSNSLVETITLDKAPI